MACISKRRNRWVIDFYDNQGKRRWKTLPKGTTKKKARDAMRDIEDLLAKGIYLPDKRIPTFEKVSMDWLEFKKPNIRDSTWNMYERYLRLHFDVIRNLKINSITIVTVEKFIRSFQNDEMKLATLRKIIVTLNQVMNYAVRHRYIDYNPVRDAERPKDRGIEESGCISILNPFEINTFLNSVKGQKYQTLFMLAIMSGARRGEILGLKWGDIDWLNNQIKIRRSFNSGQWYRPKTKSSKREIDLGPKMMSILKKWKLACSQNDLGLVFPNRTGGPIEPTHLTRYHFYPALKAAELKKIRFHDLRHTKVSLMIEQGENIKYIQNQLGHANPTVTLNVYAHLMSGVNQKSACRFENAIFERTGSKMVAEVV
jgi:integrase